MEPQQSRCQFSQQTLTSVDLDAYFRRIRYVGPGKSTLKTLRTLQGLHIAAIPFEAIDVLLGRGISLDPTAVDDKLIGRHRGGYCYEQNGLFRRVLAMLGFHVEPLMARVLWRAQPDSPLQARTHMALRVDVDGVLWLVDVGFGTAVPTEPLRWDTEVAQTTPVGRFRLLTTHFGRLLETDIGGSWSAAYELSLEPALAADLEMANWFTSTHPNSPFRRNLMVARTTSQGRAALFGNQLTIRTPEGASRRERLDTEGLEAALREVFGLPVEPEWLPMLKRYATEGLE